MQDSYRAQTVGQLKQALQDIPDDTAIVETTDGHYCITHRVALRITPRTLKMTHIENGHIVEYGDEIDAIFVNLANAY